MADASEATADAIERALAEATETLGRPAMLTGWVAVLEWTDADGDRWLTKENSPTMSWWHADGMHHAALYDWDDEDD